MNIHPTALVDPDAHVAEDVTVGPFSIIEAGAEVGSGTVLDSHVVIRSCVRVGKNNRFHQACSIGDRPQDLAAPGDSGRVEIGDGNRFREFVTINRGSEKQENLTRIGNNCYLMTYSHVAHDCTLEDKVILTNTANLSGHVFIERNAYVSALVGIHQFCRVGTYSFVGGATAVTKDVPPYAITVSDTGNRPKIFGLNLVGLKRAGYSLAQLKPLKAAFKLLFRSSLNTTQGLDRIEQEVEQTAEVTHLLSFIRNSERGIIK